MKNSLNYSISDSTKISIRDFYSYLASVISNFEGRDYRYYVRDLKDKRSLNERVTRYHFLASSHLHGLNKKLETVQELDYIRDCAPRGSYILLSNTEKKNISVVDDDLIVNLSHNLLNKYPYLEEVCLDLSNMLIKNFGSVSFRKLSEDVPKVYERQIVERKFSVEQEQKQLLESYRKNDLEIQKIIDFVDTVNLPDKDKRMIQYNLGKNLKLRRD